MGGGFVGPGMGDMFGGQKGSLAHWNSKRFCTQSMFRVGRRGGEGPQGFPACSEET